MRHLLGWVTATQARTRLVFSGAVAFLFLLLAAVAIRLLSGGAEPQPTPTPTPFDVTAVEDVSTPQAVRLQVSVSTVFPVSKAQVKEICQQVVDDFKSQGALTAMMVLVSDEHAISSEGYSIANCQYAPEGVWRETYTVQAGDYSKHWLVVEYQPKVDAGVSALVDRPTPQEFKLCREWDALTQGGPTSDDAGFEQVAGENGVNAQVVRQAVSKCIDWVAR
jgi:hypothetical protein